MGIADLEGRRQGGGLDSERQRVTGREGSLNHHHHLCTLHPSNLSNIQHHNGPSRCASHGQPKSEQLLTKDTTEATQNTPLAPSVEKAYYRKCIELKRRLNDVEEANDAARQRKARLNRAIMKMRLERAFLLEQLAKRLQNTPDGTDKIKTDKITNSD